MSVPHWVQMSSFQSEIRQHYERVWQVKSQVLPWAKGPVHELTKDFCVLEFPPAAPVYAWGYATCCMWESTDVLSPDQAEAIELHLWSRSKSTTNSGEGNHVELLAAIAHYHRTGAKLGLGHTVNFGRKWLPDSNCTHGLISLP